MARRAEAQGAAATAKSNMQRLKRALSHARRKQRDVLARQLKTAQGELGPAQSQLEMVSALINFEAGSASASSGFQAQIDQLKSLWRVLAVS
jgi:hypothetical protein